MRSGEQPDVGDDGSSADGVSLLAQRDLPGHGRDGRVAAGHDATSGAY